jgi:anti-sigma B factor antagonist
MSGSQLQITCTAVSRPHTVPVAGALDLATIPALQQELYALIDAGCVEFILDLGRLRLCDAAAMSGLVQVSRRCAERGGWLRLANPTGIVATAFRIVSLGLVVEIYPTVTAAAAGTTEDRIMG